MIAPLLAAALPAIFQLAKAAGPRFVEMVAGERAGKVAKRVARIAAGVTGAQDPDDALAILQADPDMMVAYQVKVLEQEADIEALYLQDRQDARARDIELRRAGYRNVRADILAYVAIGGLVLLAYTLVFVALPEGPGRDMLLMLSGALVVVVKDVYGFEFGSSRGSKDKDQEIARTREWPK